MFNFPLILILSDEINVSVSAPTELVTYDDIRRMAEERQLGVSKQEITIPVTGWVSDSEIRGRYPFRLNIQNERITEHMTPTLTVLPRASHLDLVVNITDAFTTMESFLEDTRKAYPAETNIAVVQFGETYQYDVLKGFVDLSGFAKTTEVVAKEEGKSPSSTDYTDADKAKLDSLEVATTVYNYILGSCFSDFSWLVKCYALC